MTAAVAREVTPSAFDSLTMNFGADKSSIALHVYETAEDGSRDVVTHVVSMTPDRTLEMVQELVTALSFTAMPKGQIIDGITEALCGAS